MREREQVFGFKCNMSRVTRKVFSYSTAVLVSKSEVHRQIATGNWHFTIFASGLHCAVAEDGCKNIQLKGE